MKNRVKIFRVNFDLTQEELAQKAKTTRQTIIAIESGRTPSLDIAIRISNIFKVSVNEIFFTNNVTQELQNNKTA